MGIGYEATEVYKENDGYKFAVFGEIDIDQNALVRQLAKKVQDGVLQKYIETEFFQGKKRLHVKDMEMVGRIEADLNRVDYAAPLIVVDGKSYTWEQFDKIILQFEGFQFKFQAIDLSDDV